MNQPRDLMNKVATSVLVVCAVIVTAAVVRKEFFAPVPSVGLAHKTVSDAESYRVHGHLRGSAKATVVITEFSDLQCPFCRRLHASLKELLARHPDDVAVLYRHFPIQAHQFALPAALAAECAGKQGAFDAFVDSVFAHQDSVGSITWESFAARSGVADSAAFHQCVMTAGTTGLRAYVDIDRAAGDKLRIEGTPVIIIGRQMTTGAAPLDSLEAWVNSELRTRHQ